MVDVKATREVREMTGQMTLCNNCNNNLLSWTSKQCWNKMYCQENGYEARVSN